MAEGDDAPDPSFVALYDGVVTDNADPKRIGRVKVRVPGLIDPTWALPFASPGGGSEQVGFFFPPKVGAEVSVFFKQGDTDHPRYAIGPWGARDGKPGIPSFALVDVESGDDIPPEESVLLPGIEVGPFQLIFDTRPGKEKLTIRDKDSPDPNNPDVIELDAANHGILISGTTAVAVRSLGAVDIDALNVRINGRVVKPTGDPI